MPFAPARQMESEVSYVEGSKLVDGQGRPDGEPPGGVDDAPPQLPWTPKPNKVRFPRHDV